MYCAVWFMVDGCGDEWVHLVLLKNITFAARDTMRVMRCGNSSVGRASASQAEGREFEPRLPLKVLHS